MDALSKSWYIGKEGRKSVWSLTVQSNDPGVYKSMSQWLRAASREATAGTEFLLTHRPRVQDVVKHGCDRPEERPAWMVAS